MAKTPKKTNEEYDEKEAAERFRKALGGALATPPRKHADEPKRRAAGKKASEKKND